MLKITSNLTEVTSSLVGRLKSINDDGSPTRDLMLRTIALDTVANMKQRIHVDGKNSADQPIGEYTNAYLKKRKENNRGTNKKVIFSLTRQMENDFSIVGGNGATGYGLGFKNTDNANKAEWLQRNTRYKSGGFGDVYKPTQFEVEHMRVVAEQFITDLLNK